MPIIRNPFRKPAGEVLVVDEPGRNLSERQLTLSDLDIKTPVEYQLSEIDDSGVFIPPSPTETKSFWSTKSTASTTTSNHRSVFNENEPFNISRESFDSYRRSFDISARSPVSDLLCSPPRQSLDSRLFPPPRTSLSFPRGSIDRPELQQVEEGFKEVDLNEDSQSPKPNQAPHSKRRSLFSRFGVDSSNGPNSTQDAQNAAVSENSRPGSSHHFGISFTGRKRGQSGQGSELRSMNRGAVEQSIAVPEVKVDS